MDYIDLIMLQVSNGNTGFLSTFIQGAGVLFFAFIKDTFHSSLPFLVVGGLLILLDLHYGVKASKKRGEEVRFSRAMRRTLLKCFEYMFMLLFGCAIAIAFESPVLKLIIIGLVFGVESISLVTNALYCKGYSVKGLFKSVLKNGGNKLGFDTSDIEVEEIKVEGKRGRKPKSKTDKK